MTKFKRHGSNSPEEAHAEAMAKGAKCLECPFYGSKQGPVYSDISRRSRLIVLGEAPNGHEVDTGENFNGRQGQVLDMALKGAGLSRRAGDVSIINSTLCSPVGNKGIMKIFLQKQSARYTAANRAARKEAKAAGRKHVNLPKPLTPQQACLPRFRQEIAEARGDVMLALGSYALKAVGAAYKIPVGTAQKEIRGDLRMAPLDKQAGHPFELPETKFKSGAVLPARTLCAAQHPTLVMHGDPSASKKTLDHMILAGRIAVVGGWEWPDAREVVVPWVETHSEEYEAQIPVKETKAARTRRLRKDPDSLPPEKYKTETRTREWATYEPPDDFFPKFEAFVEEWEDRGCPNPTVDIETAGIEWRAQVRCVGFGYGPKWEEHIIVVPLRFKSGAKYWTKGYGKKVKALLRRMMNSARLGGQNFIFDSRHLIHLGLLDDDPVKRTLWFDTMLAYKNTREGNLRRGLDAISTRFITGDGPNGLPQAVRLWKGDVDHKASDNVQKDGDLWWYCHEDVKAQHRIRKPAMEWVRRDKTEPQFAEDLRLQPILRNMGEMGVLIHEPTRLENSRILKGLIEERTREIRSIVRDPKFNPNSSQQVAEWLYAKMDYDPPINPQGKKWSEGDAMSTSIPALMELQDTNDREFHELLHRFTDAQIKYKSLSKLESGFVETLTQHKMHRQFDEYRILHANFKTTILSGRYGCSPNLMNWPKRAFINMRQMIHAAPGHVFVSADLDQAELRALIIAAGDPMLEEAIKKGMDPHTLNAASLMAKTEDELYSTYKLLMEWLALPGGDNKTRASNARMVAKIFFFAASYGAWAPTLYSHMKTFRDKASGERVFDDYTKEKNQRNYDLFHKWHPSFKGWHERKNREADTKGWITDLYGFRKIPFVYGVKKDNEPPNQEIQSTISRQMNLAIQRIADLIPFRGWSPYTGIVLQVHDELVVQVPESMVDKSIRILENEMPAMLGGRMRIGCEAGASRIWTGKSYVPLEA